MKILVLGGTVFVGRHLTQTAIERGHEVTLFNRGQHNPELFPEAGKLQGDRDGGLENLVGGQWDAVIDTCGYFPRIVKASAKLLAPNCGHYTFVSSISVYADASKPGVDEKSAVGVLADPSVEEITAQTYGPLKALCEQEVNRAFPGSSLIIRPGLIVGPHDPTDRFTYWPVRANRGGEILAPNVPSAPVQIIDVRDLSEWMLDMVEKQAVGCFNATGPDYYLSMSRFLTRCIAVTGREATLIWVDEGFLLESGVSEWIDLPLWVNSESEKGLLATNVGKAISAGLSYRSLDETIDETLLWANSRDPNHQWRAGLSQSKEAQLLALWHRRTAP
jgi:2'-hydroxyisoflavone reductase